MGFPRHFHTPLYSLSLQGEGFLQRQYCIESSEEFSSLLDFKDALLWWCGFDLKAVERSFLRPTWFVLRELVLLDRRCGIRLVHSRNVHSIVILITNEFSSLATSAFAASTVFWRFSRPPYRWTFRCTSISTTPSMLTHKYNRWRKVGAFEK